MVESVATPLAFKIVHEASEYRLVVSPGLTPVILMVGVESVPVDVTGLSILNKMGAAGTPSVDVLSRLEIEEFIVHAV